MAIAYGHGCIWLLSESSTVALEGYNDLCLVLVEREL